MRPYSPAPQKSSTFALARSLQAQMPAPATTNWTASVPTRTRRVRPGDANSGWSACMHTCCAQDAGRQAVAGTRCRRRRSARPRSRAARRTTIMMLTTTHRVDGPREDNARRDADVLHREACGSSQQPAAVHTHTRKRTTRFARARRHTHTGQHVSKASPAPPPPPPSPPSPPSRPP